MLIHRYHKVKEENNKTLAARRGTYSDVLILTSVKEPIDPEALLQFFS